MATRKRKSAGADLADATDGYVRLSHNPSGDVAKLDAQRAAIAEMLEARGIKLRQWHEDDDTSATTGVPRPGFEALLAARPAIIAVWHTDRLVRGFKDLDRVMELGSRVIAVQTSDLDLETPSGRMMARMLTSVAAFEGEHKAERQRVASWTRVSETGTPWWPRRPFGFTRKRIDTTVQIGHHAEEASALRAAYEAVLLGRPLARIADDWNQAGFRTNRDGLWTGMTVRPVLLNARNAGIMTYHGDEIGPGAWEPIVSVSMYRALVRNLEAPERRSGGGGARTGLLSGIARCHCGSTVRVGWRGRKGAEGSYRIYDCKAGHHVSPQADWLDRLVTLVVVARLARPDALQLMLAEDAPDRDALLAEADELQGEVLEVEALARPGVAPEERLKPAQVARMTAPLLARVDEIRELLGASPVASTLAPFVGSEDVQAVWDAATLEKRRAVIQALYVITLLPGRAGLPMAPERVDFASVT